MRGLTKRKALRASVRIWARLARSGDAEKPEYTNAYRCDCPMCEYHGPGKTDKLCWRCCLSADGLCSGGTGTAYLKWRKGRTKRSRMKWAKIILEALRAELKHVAERCCAVAERSDRSDMPKSVERSSRHQTCREEPMLFDMPERRRRSAASDTSAAGARAESNLHKCGRKTR